MNIKPTIEELLAGIKCLEYLTEQICRQKVYSHTQSLGKAASLTSAKAFRKEFENMIQSYMSGKEKTQARQICIFRVISIEKCEVVYIGKCAYQQIENQAEQIYRSIETGCICQYAEVSAEESEYLYQLMVQCCNPVLNPSGRRWNKKDWECLNISSMEEAVSRLYHAAEWKRFVMPEEDWDMLLESAPDSHVSSKEKANYIRLLEKCRNTELRIRFQGGIDEIIRKAEENNNVI